LFKSDNALFGGGLLLAIQALIEMQVTTESSDSVSDSSGIVSDSSSNSFSDINTKSSERGRDNCDNSDSVITVTGATNGSDRCCRQDTPCTPLLSLFSPSSLLWLVSLLLPSELSAGWHIERLMWCCDIMMIRVAFVPIDHEGDSNYSNRLLFLSKNVCFIMF
jgi:hypothetical protein